MAPGPLPADRRLHSPEALRVLVPADRRLHSAEALPRLPPADRPLHLAEALQVLCPEGHQHSAETLPDVTL